MLFSNIYWKILLTLMRKIKILQPIHLFRYKKKLKSKSKLVMTDGIITNEQWVVSQIIRQEVVISLMELVKKYGMEIIGILVL